MHSHYTFDRNTFKGFASFQLNREKHSWARREPGVAILVKTGLKDCVSFFLRKKQKTFYGVGFQLTSPI